MEITILPLNLIVLLPQIIVAVTAMVVLLADVLTPAGEKRWLAYLSLAGVALAGVVTAGLWGQAGADFQGMAILDHFALFLDLLFLGVAVLVLLLSAGYLKEQGLERGEYYALVLFATAGMMLLGTATDLITLFLGLETFSLALYVLAGFARPRLESQESALKYFLLGAFASGFLLYGIALTYGATGSTNLARIGDFLGAGYGLGDPMLLLGLGLILVGFGFKIAMAPFHMWTPDVYEGAPTSVTAFMAAATKTAGFAALLRVLMAAFPSLEGQWVPLLAVLSVVTMTVGNVVAIVQGNIKRMLAYSSIAHAGYVLIAVVAGGRTPTLPSPSQGEGVSAALFYLVVYALMTLGAFGVVIALSRQGREVVRIQDYAGLAQTHPWLAAAMAVFMFSLAGFPPTAGFVGKFYVFSAAVRSGLAWLAVLGVLNSVLSVYYYAGVVVLMYMHAPAEGRPAPGSKLSALVAAALVLALVGTLGFGVFPAGLIGLARAALLAL